MKEWPLSRARHAERSEASLSKSRVAENGQTHKQIVTFINQLVTCRDLCAFSFIKANPNSLIAARWLQ
jgi:hypothetical protein